MTTFRTVPFAPAAATRTTPPFLLPLFFLPPWGCASMPRILFTAACRAFADAFFARCRFFSETAWRGVIWGCAGFFPFAFLGGVATPVENEIFMLGTATGPDFWPPAAGPPASLLPDLRRRRRFFPSPPAPLATALLRDLTTTTLDAPSFGRIFLGLDVDSIPRLAATFCSRSALRFAFTVARPASRARLSAFPSEILVASLPAMTCWPPFFLRLRFFLAAGAPSTSILTGSPPSAFPFPFPFFRRSFFAWLTSASRERSSFASVLRTPFMLASIVRKCGDRNHNQSTGQSGNRKQNEGRF
eukprot:Opistho-1_new@3620